MVISAYVETIGGTSGAGAIYLYFFDIFLVIVQSEYIHVHFDCVRWVIVVLLQAIFHQSESLGLSI